MPGEDLYSLGQQAGIVPASDEVNPGGYGGDFSDPAPEPSVIGPSPQGLQGRTGVMPGELGVPTAPLPDVSPSQSQLAGASVSSGHTGFSLKTHDLLSSLGPEVDAANAGADARAESEKASLMAPINAASEAGRSANNEELKASQDLAKQNGIEQLAFSKINDKFARDEAEANARADAISNQGKANYMAALMDFRASKVDPNQLWNSQSGGMQFGMLCAAFAHDFLGTKGMQTSAMDTLNKSIDRNIASQVEAIKTKGEVADGFKSLWYMQRSQAASDAEARLRVRGFLLDSAKQQVVAHLAQYQSALATAQSHAAQAKLDEETAKTTVGVYEKINENAIALRKQALDVVSDNKKYAMEGLTNSIALQRLKLDQDKEQREQMETYVPDTSPSGEGRLRYKFFSGTPETQDKIKLQLGALNSFDHEMNLIRQEMAKVGPIAPGDIPQFMRTPAGARLKNLQQSAIMHQVYADSGKVFNQQELDVHSNMIPIDTYLTNGDRDKVIADTSNSMHDAAFSKMAPFVTEVGPGDPAWNPKENKPFKFSPYSRESITDNPSAPAQSSLKENKTIISPTPKSGDQEKFDTALSHISEPSDKLEVSEQDLREGKTKVGGDPWDRFNKEPLDTVNAGKDVRDEHKAFIDSYFKKSPYELGTTKGAKESLDKGYNVKYGDLLRPKAFEEGMVRLKELAQGGGPMAERAIHELAMQAKPYVGTTSGTGDQDDYKGAFALFMLHEISANTGKDVEPHADTSEDLGQ